MSDPASVLISTAALLAVAVMAGAHGSLRARVDELQKMRPELDALRAGQAESVATLRTEAAKAAEAAKAERAKDRATMLALRLIVRRLRRAFGAPLPPDDPEPDPIGFRPPP